MNKFKSILTVAALTVGSTAWAGPRTLQEAMSLAADFVAETSTFNHVKLTPVGAIENEATIARAPQLYQAYYVFNVGENEGFVIVSGDDDARAVLAYGDTGSFDANNIPDNVKYWLNRYKEQIEYIGENGITVTAMPGGVEEPGNVIVEPLTAGIAWDQGYPYNSLCPKVHINRCFTGCAATAMSMVMKYHAYPEKGQGSFHYKTDRKKLAVDVELGEVYEWDKILGEYDGSASEESKNQVAMLMQHVGASLYMDYGTASMGGSGATIYSQNPALIHNFHYNPNMYYLNHDYVTEAEWTYMVRQELDAKRPLLYSGLSKTAGGGHSFVCDGYTDAGYYHFNWGWSGDLNGYYAMDALEPGTGGAGAGAGQFSDGQVITIGLRPENTGAPVSGFCLGMAASGRDAGSFSLNKVEYTRDERIIGTVVNLWNNTGDIVEGEWGMGLFQGDKFIGYIGESETPRNGILKVGYGYGKRIYRGTLPADLAEGTYQIAFCSETQYEPVPSIARIYGGKLASWNAEVTADKIVISQPENRYILSSNQPVEMMGATAVGGKVHFQVPVVNKGGAGYYGKISVDFRAEGSDEVMARIVLPTIVKASATPSIEVKDALPAEITAAGKYVVSASYERNGKWVDLNAEMKTTIEVGAEGGVSIDTEAADRFVAYAANGVIRVENAAAGELVQIYTANGSLVASERVDASGAAVIAAPQKGILLVRQGNQTVKVVL